jgi:transcriptional repressor NrdR
MRRAQHIDIHQFAAPCFYCGVLLLYMICPVCYHKDTKVIDSRIASDGLSIRRRRECLKCSFRFSTNEEMEILDLTVNKRNGSKENYSREKMMIGLRKSLEKRPITEEEVKKLVNLIERDLQALRKNTVESEEIGQIVMMQLKKVDKVAFIRFASVYKSFEDLESFQEELNKLISSRREK